MWAVELLAKIILAAIAVAVFLALLPWLLMLLIGVPMSLIERLKGDFTSIPVWECLYLPASPSPAGGSVEDGAVGVGDLRGPQDHLRARQPRGG